MGWGQPDRAEDPAISFSLNDGGRNQLRQARVLSADQARSFTRSPGQMDISDAAIALRKMFVRAGEWGACL